MACQRGNDKPYSYGLYSYGLYSYGLYSYGHGRLVIHLALPWTDGSMDGWTRDGRMDGWMEGRQMAIGKAMGQGNRPMQLARRSAKAIGQGNRPGHLATANRRSRAVAFASR